MKSAEVRIIFRGKMQLHQATSKTPKKQIAFLDFCLCYDMTEEIAAEQDFQKALAQLHEAGSVGITSHCAIHNAFCQSARQMRIKLEEQADSRLLT